MSNKERGIFATSVAPAASFAKNNVSKVPDDCLSVDVMRAQQLGYGCHYGAYKVDHPHTREENEEILAAAKKKKTKAAPAPVVKKCLYCGQIIPPPNVNRRYCDEVCKRRFHDNRNRGGNG